MATSSALTLRPLNPKSPFSSLSLSPLSLPIKRASISLMASASKAPLSPSDSINPFMLSKSLQADTKTTGTPPIKQTSRGRNPPPDLESHLFSARIIDMSLPFVSPVSELIIAQFLYLQGVDREKPIYLHIYSSGTSNDDFDTIALDTEGFAIYDIMMSSPNKLHTILTGPCSGHAALLGAAGTKGERYMMPNAKAWVRYPKMPSFGEMQTSDLVGRAREALIQRNKFAELLAMHTNNSIEKVFEVMDSPYHMNFEKAKEFGLVDKLFDPEEHKRHAGFFKQ